MKKFYFFLSTTQYSLPIKCKIIFSFFLLLTINGLVAQNYYLYVASESDDTVSLLKFDGNKINEERRIELKKLIKSIGEKCKVSIRNIRREALSLIHI